MLRVSQPWLRVVAVVGPLFGATATTGADPAEERTVPPVRPVASRRMEVQPWETTSSSPFGGWRSGGWDQRNFVFSPDGRLLAGEDAGGWQLELWDTSTGKSLGRFGRTHDPVV